MSNYRYKKKIHKFWKDRLKKKESLVCSNDEIIDKYEIDEFAKLINNNKTILEIGCGNGIFVRKLLKKRKIKRYLGTDFVEEFVNYSRKKNKFQHIDFQRIDMTNIKRDTFKKKWDLIISKRAIQNILSTKLQLKIIDNLGFFLKEKGKIILCESSHTSQYNINKYRKIFGLHKIKPPFHNLFFNDSKIKKNKFNNIRLLSIDNFSSNFYFITRIINAAFKKTMNQRVKNSDVLNKISTLVPNKIFAEDFSQVKFYIFVKKNNS